MIRPHYVPLYQSVCHSEKLADLADHGARLFYVLLLTHCDAHGRCGARPRPLWSLVWSMFGPQKDVAKFLDDLERVGLITRHEHAGEPYLCIPDWEEKAGKVGRPERRGPTSWPTPAPREESADKRGTTPADCGTSPADGGSTPADGGSSPASRARADPIRSEQSREEPSRAEREEAPPEASPPPESAAKRPRKAPTGPLAEAIRHWEAEWERTRMGQRYAIRAKDGVAFSEILKLPGVDVEEIKSRTTRLLESHDEFYLRAASPGVLASQWNQLGFELHAVGPVNGKVDPMNSWAAQELMRRRAAREAL